jgi:hypothetical protein
LRICQKAFSLLKKIELGMIIQTVAGKETEIIKICSNSE